MTGYEYAKQFNTTEEKVCVLILDAIKAAYNMAGKNFDNLTESQKMAAIDKIVSVERRDNL